MNTFPTMNDVNNLIEQEEKAKRGEFRAKQYMRFDINSRLSDEDRFKDVAEDIAIEYPELSEETRKSIAGMEKPIQGCHEDYEWFYRDELRVIRLFNILQVTYTREDLLEVYKKSI